MSHNYIYTSYNYISRQLRVRCESFHSFYELENDKYVSQQEKNISLTQNNHYSQNYEKIICDSFDHFYLNL